jgi:hypothetical protein
MIWIIPAMVAASAAAIHFLSEADREARRRRDEAQRDMELSIEEHERRIERYLEESDSSYRYDELRQFHFSSFKVADEAYQLLQARFATIRDLKKRVFKLFKLRNTLRKQASDAKSYKERGAIWTEIKLCSSQLRELEQHLNEEAVIADGFKLKLDHFNHTTHRLKLQIRDHCGWRGRQWYERAEERKRNRNSS